MYSKVVIVDYLRTPISRSNHKNPEKDIFNSLRMDDCTAELIKQILKKNNIPPEVISRCIIGCANQSGEQFLYGGRAISLLAGLPYSTPTIAVDVQCGSSLGAIQQGAMEIRMGYSNVILAGGLEHMTHVPMRYGSKPNQRLLQENIFNLKKISKSTDDLYDAEEDSYLLPGMGDTAELLAQESGITREEMDKWSLQSHKRAVQAQQEGFFIDEIMPAKVMIKNGELISVTNDQCIRHDTNFEKLSNLPPAFKENGLITAGNSSPLNTGASMVLLMSEEMSLKYNVQPLAIIESFGWGGVDPLLMGKGPLPASKMALEKANLSFEDVDFWEINEAFAVVPLWNIQQMKIKPEKVNVKGGAIALGHPLGMTGARLVGTLARILNVERGTYGVATVCIGGGQGLSILLKTYQSA